MIPPFVSLEAARSANAVLADVRWYLDGRSGRAAYDAGHLAGAVFVDLERVLAGLPSPDAGRHPLPDPERFAAGLGAIGIGEDDRVVAYDDAGGVIAARLVYLLRITGHDAALLDGGLGAGMSPLERVVTERPPKAFAPRPWPEAAIAAIEDVLAGDAVVIDARDASRFSGEVEPVDPRAGHIPGAKSLPCRDHVDESGRLRPAPVLRERLAAVGIEEHDTPVISYCGSGITACHNLLVLEQLGFANTRLYPGSWSQYSWRHDLPVATGEA
ncbi:MAG: sulfurtransferase [Actinomycetota bacterium]|nr:sulfurtransferase [Actinomycetota bacterium]